MSFDGIALGGLDAAETASLRRARMRRSGCTSGAAGNPLFLLAMRDEDDGRRIKDVVLRRVDRLGEPAYEVLALAAVAGQTFRTAVVGYIGVLDQALTAGLLTPTATPDRLAFSHALIRQTLYEDLSDVKRAHLHRVVAERLETQLRPRPGRARPSLLPRTSPDRARAGHPLRARSGRARGRGARVGGRGAAPRAGARVLTPEDRAELLLALGEARMRGGHAAARTRVRGGRRARPPRFAGAARARRDRLRRPLLRGGRDRRRADRAAARGAARRRGRAARAGAGAAGRDPALRRRHTGVDRPLRRGGRARPPARRRQRAGSGAGRAPRLAAARRARRGAHASDAGDPRGRCVRGSRCRRCRRGSSIA